jgi:hypothetical protein
MQFLCCKFLKKQQISDKEKYRIDLLFDSTAGIHFSNRKSDIFVTIFLKADKNIVQPRILMPRLQMQNRT